MYKLSRLLTSSTTVDVDYVYAAFKPVRKLQRLLSMHSELMKAVTICKIFAYDAGTPISNGNHLPALTP